MDIRRIVYPCCLLSAIIFCSNAGAFGQAAPPPQSTFRSDTELISVDVSVLDGDRRPVRGLTPADFVILEDGKPRPVVAFAPVELPGPAASPATEDTATALWTREAPYDLAANDLPAEGRLVTILFDRSIPAGTAVRSAQEIAAAAVDALAPGDLASIARSSGFANEGGRQGFTTDRRLLLEAINSPMMGMTSAELNPSPVPGVDPSTTDCYCGLCVYDTLNNIAMAMRDSPRRRKVLLFVGSAISIQEPSPTSECFSVVKEPRNRMMRELEMSNVTVHTLDPAGLFTTALSAGFIVKAGTNPIQLAKIPAERNAANAVRIDNLRVLPDHTGGRLVTNTNHPAELLPAVLEESRSYYLLGFEPAAPADGKFHRIEVRVDRPGVRVQGRRWYTTGESGAAGDLAAAWREAGPRELTDALRAPVPRSDLPLRLNVTPLLAETGSTAPVAVLLGATLPPASGARRLAAILSAFDARGRAVVVHNQTLELSTSNGPPSRTDEGLLALLALPPGQYEIRAAVRDDATGTIGSVYSSAVVPEAGRAPLELAGPVLRGPSPPAMTAHALSDLVPFVPTAARRFRPSDDVLSFVQLRTSGSAGAVTLRTTILDTSDVVRFSQVETIDPGSLPPGVSGHSRPLRLTSLEPGAYLLRVEASAAGRSVHRETRFEIVTEP